MEEAGTGIGEAGATVSAMSCIIYQMDGVKLQLMGHRQRTSESTRLEKRIEIL